MEPASHLGLIWMRGTLGCRRAHPESRRKAVAYTIDPQRLVQIDRLVLIMVSQHLFRGTVGENGGGRERRYCAKSRGAANHQFDINFSILLSEIKTVESQIGLAEKVLGQSQRRGLRPFQILQQCGQHPHEQSRPHGHGNAVKRAMDIFEPPREVRAWRSTGKDVANVFGPNGGFCRSRAASCLVDALLERDFVQLAVLDPFSERCS